jgi:hypothetical protein
VNPLVHQSGFEYLALGVPCLNFVDEHLEETIGSAYGGTFPLRVAELKHVRTVTQAALACPYRDWEIVSTFCRSWMEAYAHPRETIARYIDLYEGARVA